MNRSWKWMAWFLMVGIFLGLAGLSSCSKQSPTEVLPYQCPMHPTYIQDQPGDCPICGMKLVPIETKTAPQVEVNYVCPMHPEVTSDQAGRCPKCGMKLEPIGAQSETEPVSEKPIATPSGERKILYYRSPMDPKVTSPGPAKDQMGMEFVPVYEDEVSAKKGGPEGWAPVSVNERGMQLAGIQTALANREKMKNTVRAFGVVAVDESRVKHIHTKIAGFVDKLFVNFTGQAVRQGQPILSIYSPELLASQEEFLRVLESTRRSTNQSPEANAGVEELVTAARRRLQLFDVPDSFIADLEKTGISKRVVTLQAPITGFVAAKQIFEGQQVDPSMDLFTVTDLSRVWIEADFYEYEAKGVKLGQEATFTVPYDPKLQLQGQVTYIYPFLNQESRTLKVRFEFDNRDLALKPGMYVNVTLERQAEETVVIPDSAVVDSGLRQIVFVEEEAGRFIPREVQLGIRSEGRVQVISGVQAGERIVVRGNFLIDSESRLRSAIGGATGKDESIK